MIPVDSESATTAIINATSTRQIHQRFRLFVASMKTEPISWTSRFSEEVHTVHSVHFLLDLNVKVIPSAIAFAFVDVVLCNCIFCRLSKSCNSNQSNTSDKWQTPSLSSTICLPRHSLYPCVMCDVYSMNNFVTFLLTKYCPDLCA